MNTPHCPRTGQKVTNKKRTERRNQKTSYLEWSLIHSVLGYAAFQATSVDVPNSLHKLAADASFHVASALRTTNQAGQLDLHMSCLSLVASHPRAYYARSWIPQGSIFFAFGLYSRMFDPTSRQPLHTGSLRFAKGWAERYLASSWPCSGTWEAWGYIQ